MRASNTATVVRDCLEAPLVPRFDLDLHLYQKFYQDQVQIFLQYIDTTPEILGGNKLRCEYLINNMELAMLLLVQARLASDRPESLLDQNIYGPLLSEIFFIRTCKVHLGIERISDFTTQFSDALYPVVRVIVERINPEAATSLFGSSEFTAALSVRPHPTMSGSEYSHGLSAVRTSGGAGCASVASVELVPVQRSISIFRNQTRDLIGRLVRDAYSAKVRASCLLKSYAEIKEIKALIEPLFKDLPSLTSTLASLEESIEFRKKRKIYIESLRKHEIASALKELTDESLLFLSKMRANVGLLGIITDTLSDHSSGLTSDEASLLRAEAASLSSGVSVPVSRDVLLLSGAELALLTAEERDLLKGELKPPGSL